jgi:hypothetical protein
MITKCDCYSSVLPDSYNFFELIEWNQCLSNQKSTESNTKTIDLNKVHSSNISTCFKIQ